MKIKQKIAVFWFRRDLRLEDNHGFYQALKSGLNVLPVFIFDKNILHKITEKSDARIHFIHQQLDLLNHQLISNGSSLFTSHDTPLKAFQEIFCKYEVAAVYCNSDYEPYAVNRDAEVRDFLDSKGIDFLAFKDQVIFEKKDILKKDDTPYTVYTPYKNQWKRLFAEKPVDSYPSEKLLQNCIRSKPKEIIRLKDLGFIKSDLTFPSQSIDNDIIINYNQTRDFPALKTSGIGLHLRFGTLSIREAAKKASKLNSTWLDELIWREFFQMIIFHFPHSANSSFKVRYDRIEWRNDEKEFELWCKGETGFPLVDAGMRELNTTGFMHNRVRMVVASFLCKNLLIDWRWGEACFAEKLLDYDLAANVGNWQWAAGSGCDAAPYFRVFNPEVQAQKFDKQNEYIRKWVPEFDQPNYVPPMVDLKESAKRAIQVYKKALV